MICSDQYPWKSSHNKDWSNLLSCWKEHTNHGLFMVVGDSVLRVSYMLNIGSYSILHFPCCPLLPLFLKVGVKWIPTNLDWLLPILSMKLEGGVGGGRKESFHPENCVVISNKYTWIFKSYGVIHSASLFHILPST